MTASTANGFAHVLYTPSANTCTSAPYAFHAEYSTANARGNTWSAHLTNVSFSDELGHFEYCPQLDAEFNCAVAGADDPGGLDVDDGQNFCVPGKDAWVVHINGCFFNDVDFDGPSYQKDWPGTSPDPRTDQKLHPEPVIFTSPTTNGHQYPTIQFEADLGAIESTCKPAPAAPTRLRARRSIRSSRHAPTAERARGRRAATPSRAPSTTSAAARRPSSRT